MKKKIFLAALCATGVMAFAGCGNQEQGADAEAVSDTEAVREAALNYNVKDYVKLGDYKKLDVKYPVPSITEEDVEMYIQDQIDENTEYREITDRAAQNGDSVNIDYTGTVDGEEFEGGSDSGFDLVLGSGEFLEDFENGLIGKNAGETVTVPVTFPEDYFDETMAGKVAEFTIKINSVNEVIVPEYNDDFVAQISEYKTTEEYENAVREELMIDSQQESAEMAGDDALAMAVENAEINGYPQDLYDVCYDDTLDSYQFYAEMMGMDFDEFLSEYMSEEDIEDATVAWVNEIMVVQAIAEKEGLEISDKNYKTEVESLAEEYEYDSVDEFEADYDKMSIMTTLMRNKVVDFLYQSANVEEVSQEEYYGEDDTEILMEDTEA